jgi:hypothetical protein
MSTMLALRITMLPDAASSTISLPALSLTCDALGVFR